MTGIIGSGCEIGVFVEPVVPDQRISDNKYINACPVNGIVGLQRGAEVCQQLVHVVNQVTPSLGNGLFNGFPARQGTKPRPIICSSQHIGMLRRGSRYTTFPRLVWWHCPFSPYWHLVGIDAAQGRHEFASSRSGTARQCILPIDDRALRIVHRSALQGA